MNIFFFFSFYSLVHLRILYFDADLKFVWLIALGYYFGIYYLNLPIWMHIQNCYNGKIMPCAVKRKFIENSAVTQILKRNFDLTIRLIYFKWIFGIHNISMRSGTFSKYILSISHFLKFKSDMRYQIEAIFSVIDAIYSHRSMVNRPTHISHTNIN